ncbi:MAG: ABC transporter substrate-binding protein, partial [Bacteroidota bacterium]
MNNPDSYEDNAALQEQVTRLSDLSYLRAPENLLSSGPYTVGEWVTGQKIELNRKQDWWGDQIATETHPTLVAYPDQLVYQTITDPAGAYAAIKSEDVDVANRIIESGFEELQQDSLAGLKYDYLTVNTARVYFVAVNTKKPKLQQKEVRQALAYAFDVDEVLETVYLGYGQRTASPVYPTVDIYNKELEIKKQNIEKAKALLQQAGWEDSNNNGIVDKEIDGELTELSLQYIASPSPQSKNTALLFQSHAKLAGIDIQVEQQAVQEYFASYRSKNYELFSTGSTITPNWNPRQFWHSEGFDRTGFASPETDELIDQIVAELDESKRVPLYKELQAIIADKQPVIFLHVPKTTIAVHKRFDYDVFEWYEGFEPRWFKLKEEYKNLSQN